MFAKHICTLSLTVTATLTFDPETPNSIVMTNHHTKLEAPCSLVIDRTRFVYGPTDQRTDRPTDGPTDMCKAICPHFFEGGHKNGS